MCCCVYLSDSVQQPLSNKHVTEWLEKAIAVTGKKWLVRERKITVRRWFRREDVIYRYELFCPISFPEYQAINFYRDNTDWSINHVVTAELIVAYLIGVVAGKS